MNNDVIITKSAEETEKLGEQFAKQLKVGDIVCLYGDLGYGKTTFTKGVARGLGISSRIISPTFTLIRQHEVSSELPIKTIYHIDLYRLENRYEIKNIGFDEITANPSGLTIIEWPEKLGILLPKKRIDVRFSIDGNTRVVQIKRYE